MHIKPLASGAEILEILCHLATQGLTIDLLAALNILYADFTHFIQGYFIFTCDMWPTITVFDIPISNDMVGLLWT